MPDNNINPISAQINQQPQEAAWNPSPEDKADIDLVMKSFDSAKEARKKWDKQWDTYERYYDCDQWINRRAEGKAMPVANIIFPVIQTILPIMTDSQPGFDVGAKTPQDYDFADMLSTLVHNWWNIRSMNNTLVETIMESCFYGNGIQKVIWDESLEGGLGDVRVDDIDPRDIFVPKDAIDFNKNCSFVIHRMCKPLGELRRLFPEKADYIFATGDTKEREKTQLQNYDGNVQLVTPIDKKAKDIPLDSGAGYDATKVVEFYEMWLDDETLESIEQEDKDNPGQMKTVKQKRYPNGKIITVTSNRVLLQSAENPRKDGLKPFVRYPDMIRPKRFYADGEIKQLKDPQDMVNKTLACIFDCMNLMGNPIWITDTNSGVEPETITNAVGLIIVKNPGTEVRRENAPAVPAYIFNFYSELLKLVDQLSGVHDITQGRKPTGITAAEAIAELQEAAQTRIRLKERNLQTSLTQVGYLIVNTMMQYYTVPRVTRITKQKGWPEFFEFYFKNNPDGTYQYVRKTHTYDEQQKKYIQVQDWQESGTTKGVFDIEVQSGTSLPFMKQKRSNLAIQLFDKQAIDQEDLLEKLDWPKADQVMKRMKAAAAAQAGPSGAPPPGGA